MNEDLKNELKGSLDEKLKNLEQVLQLEARLTRMRQNKAKIMPNFNPSPNK